MPGLCTRYSEAGAVHTAWHWIRAMYKARTSTDIDIEKWREKRRNVTEVQRSGVAFWARTLQSLCLGNVELGQRAGDG